MDTHNIQCLGFIMDGNRRWATEQGLQTYEGHKQGSEVLSSMVRNVRDAGIPHAVFYAFSTENWNRSEEEVSYLMDLFQKYLRDIKEKLDKEDGDVQNETPVIVKVVGRRGDFPQDIQDQMAELEERNVEVADQAQTTIWLALSYGGRAEIVEAVNKAIAAGTPVDEDTFNQLLWTADMPDPDMIIRTSGEHRLSNFLTWKSVYSEFYFIAKHWPALTTDDFTDILDEYGRRNRRKGK